MADDPYAFDTEDHAAPGVGDGDSWGKKVVDWAKDKTDMMLGWPEAAASVGINTVAPGFAAAENVLRGKMSQKDYHDTKAKWQYNPDNPYAQNDLQWIGAIPKAVGLDKGIQYAGKKVSDVVGGSPEQGQDLVGAALIPATDGIGTVFKKALTPVGGAITNYIKPSAIANKVARGSVGTDADIATVQGNLRNAPNPVAEYPVTSKEAAATRPVYDAEGNITDFEPDPVGSPISALTDQIEHTKGGPSIEAGKIVEQQQKAIDNWGKIRDAATTPLRNDALASAGPVPIYGIVAQIDNMLKNSVHRFNGEAVSSLKALRRKLLTDAKPSAPATAGPGSPISMAGDPLEVPPGPAPVARGPNGVNTNVDPAGTMSAADLYEVRKQITSAIQSAYARKNLPYNAARTAGLEGDMNGLIDNAIRDAGAGAKWDKYLDTYSKYSKEIELAQKRMELALNPPVETRGMNINAASKEASPSLPHMLSHKVVLANYGIGAVRNLLVGKQVRNILSLAAGDPSRMAALLEKLPPAQRGPVGIAVHAALAAGTLSANQPDESGNDPYAFDQ